MLLKEFWFYQKKKKKFKIIFTREPDCTVWLEKPWTSYFCGSFSLKNCFMEKKAKTRANRGQTSCFSLIIKQHRTEIFTIFWLEKKNPLIKILNKSKKKSKKRKNKIELRYYLLFYIFSGLFLVLARFHLLLLLVLLVLSVSTF